MLCLSLCDLNLLLVSLSDGCKRICIEMIFISLSLTDAMTLLYGFKSTWLWNQYCGSLLLCQEFGLMNSWGTEHLDHQEKLWQLAL